MAGAAAGAAAVSVAALGSAGLLGCAGQQDETQVDKGPLRMPLARLSGDARVRAVYRGQAVEIHRDGERIVARSLLCTHMGCTVRFVESERLYRCPCHKGVYDADGRAIDGPPPRPLRLLHAAIEGDTLVVSD
jgi:Rieske Fe-S protein